MSEGSEGRRYPEVGALSPDGSRTWNGQFWVRRQSPPPPADAPHAVARPARPVARPARFELGPDRRSLRLGSAAVAAVVGAGLGHVHLSLPPAGSLDAALRQMALANELWSVFTFGCVVAILSLGRQGIDLLLLRATGVGFVLGVAALAGLVLLGPSLGALVGMLVSGLTYAVLGGPLMAAIAALANLIWYRSFSGLRPQLWVFNRGA